MRKRFNPNAVCSSENYSASKRIHKELLQERHNSFSVNMATFSSVEGEGKKAALLPVAKSHMVTIHVFGQPVKVTQEEYENHCQGFTKHY